MGGVYAAGQKAFDKVFSTMDSILRTTLPRANQTLDHANGLIHEAAESVLKTTLPKTHATLDNANELISDFKGIPEHLTETAQEVGAVTKIGIGIAGLKFCSDMGVSWYRAIKLTKIASSARNDLKKLADHTTKAEDKLVEVLESTSSDLKSSVSQFTEDAHKTSQSFGHMTESLSQSSAEISSTLNQANRNFGYMTHITADFLGFISQDIHQTSRCFRVTCLSLTASAFVATMTYLQNSSCDHDPDSIFCTAPLKSMIAMTIAASFVAMRILAPNSIYQNNEVLIPNEKAVDLIDRALKEHRKLKFFIPEEGIDQDVEWTQEQLESIKATNIDIFTIIEAKRKFGGKWHKQELEWLLSQDKNIFLNVIISGIYSTSDCLDKK